MSKHAGLTVMERFPGRFGNVIRNETLPAKPLPKASSLGVLDCYVIVRVAAGMETAEDWQISYPSNETYWVEVKHIAAELNAKYDLVYRHVKKLRESGLIICQKWGDGEGEGEEDPRQCRLTTKGVAFTSRNINIIRTRILGSKYDTPEKLKTYLDLMARISDVSIGSGTNGLSASNRKRQIKAKTKFGKAIIQNEREINLAIAGVILQIDAKLDTLHGERPNSEETIAEINATVAEYERIRSELESIRAIVAAFNKGVENEVNLARSMTRFAESVRSWWDRRHDVILSRAFDMGLFATAVGICSLAGAGGRMAVAVSAVLAGGKPAAQALRGLFSKRFMID